MEGEGAATPRSRDRARDAEVAARLRLAAAGEARGAGHGAALIRAAVTMLQARPGITRAMLGAQTHAIGFYQKLGFSVCGPIYDDAGIPHRDMSRDL